MTDQTGSRSCAAREVWRDFDLLLFYLLCISGLVFWALVGAYLLGGIRCG